MRRLLTPIAVATTLLTTLALRDDAGTQPQAPRLVFGVSNDTLRVGQSTTLYAADLPGDQQQPGFVIRDTTGYGALAKALRTSVKAIVANPPADLAPNSTIQPGALTASNAYHVVARRQGTQDFEVDYTDGNGNVRGRYRRRLYIVSAVPSPPKPKPVPVPPSTPGDPKPVPAPIGPRVPSDSLAYPTGGAKSAMR